MSSNQWLIMSGDLNYIFSKYIFSVSFVSQKKCWGGGLNNLMWIRMAGGLISVYFYGYDYLANVLFPDFQEQAGVSVKC